MSLVLPRGGGYLILSCCVAVFAKAPVPGRVKTRLVPWLSESQAAELHTRLVERTLRTCADSGLPFELWAGEEHAVLHRLAAAFDAPLQTQCGGDLGQRMAHAIGSVLQRSTSVLVIGSDCPGLDAHYLCSAERVLRRDDWVIGPARDGGYVLIGTRRRDPAVFEGISWGSASVLQQTRARLLRAGWRWQALETLQDLDEPGDAMIARQRWPELFAAL